MNGKRKKYLATTYVFLILSVIFYALFFLNEPSQQTLPIIGCAFLCDLAAAVYLIKTLKE